MRHWRRLGMSSHYISVIACTLLAVAEDSVGFGDAHEAPSGGWVGGIVVWVVGFGEGEVGAFDLGGGGVRADFEDFIVVWLGVVVVGVVIVEGRSCVERAMGNAEGWGGRCRAEEGGAEWHSSSSVRV